MAILIVAITAGKGKVKLYIFFILFNFDFDFMEYNGFYPNIIQNIISTVSTISNLLT